MTEIKLSTFNNDNFERGAGKLKEALWLLCRSLFFATWLPVPSSFKAALLRLFGAKVGQGVVIRSRVNITFPWRFECGNHVWIGEEVLILSLDKVTIGDNTCISQRATLCTGSHDFEKASFDLVTEPIEIGSSCWIGAQSFVGPGIDMGDGSRCLPGAVVTKDVEGGTTVGGVPAREIK